MQLVLSVASFIFFAISGDGLVQERRNSSANALELRLSCAKPSIYGAVCVQLNQSKFRWSRGHICNSSYYHHQTGSINLSRCCHILRGCVSEVVVHHILSVPSYKPRASCFLFVLFCFRHHCADYETMMCVNNSIHYEGWNQWTIYCRVCV